MLGSGASLPAWSSTWPAARDKIDRAFGFLGKGRCLSVFCRNSRRNRFAPGHIAEALPGQRRRSDSQAGHGSPKTGPRGGLLWASRSKRECPFCAQYSKSQKPLSFPLTLHEPWNPDVERIARDRQTVSVWLSASPIPDNESPTTSPRQRVRDNESGTRSLDRPLAWSSRRGSPKLGSPKIATKQVGCP
jgi:hypothetical protein